MFTTTTKTIKHNDKISRGDILPLLIQIEVPVETLRPSINHCLYDNSL